jgi:hypothetical protein
VDSVVAGVGVGDVEGDGNLHLDGSPPGTRSAIQYTEKHMGLRFAPTLLVLVLCARAHAEPRAPDVSEELKLFETTERGQDPLGIDDSTGRGLEEAARALKPKPPPPKTALRGEVLTALEQVEESHHEVALRLAQGLAFVSTRVRFSSRSDAAAELAYRLPLPEVAVVTRVRVCSARDCRDVTPNTAQREPPEPAVRAEAAPFLWAVPIRDARGRALSILAGSVTKAAPLELEIDYVASAPVRGGKARFTLPSRGQDPRVRPAGVRVQSGYPGALLSADALSVDAAQRAQVVATLRQPVTVHEVARCHGRPCRRDYQAAPAAPLSARPVWLALDASPSMEGPARGRADAALAALLGALPAQTPVRVFAFAQRAVELGSYEAGGAPLAPLSDALLMDLGPSSRLSSVVMLGARERARLIVLSDGLLDDSARERRAQAQLHRLGVEPWLVALGDAPPAHPEPFAWVLPVAALADQALRDGDLEPLAEALSALASPPRSAGLFAGAERVRESAPLRAPPAMPSAPWLAHWLARGASAVKAPAHAAAPPPPAPPDTGMPAVSVLDMLRTQLVPKARACLRTDRKGRGDYAVALTFHALFARREIAEARVEGTIEAKLRACLEAALDDLRVPVFSGRIRVRYPIHTEREPPPPVIELEPEVWKRVERVISPNGPSGAPVVD